jgi:hypothetical protein
LNFLALLNVHRPHSLSARSGKRDDPVIIADAMIAGAQFTRRVPSPAVQ